MMWNYAQAATAHLQLLIASIDRTNLREVEDEIKNVCWIALNLFNYIYFYFIVIKDIEPRNVHFLFCVAARLRRYNS